MPPVDIATGQQADAEHALLRCPPRVRYLIIFILKQHKQAGLTVTADENLHPGCSEQLALRTDLAGGQRDTLYLAIQRDSGS